MIHKIINYCWFGYGEKNKEVKRCIKTWKKYAPDYKIKEWNESNFDISLAPLYVKQAYDLGKWAFVTDYVRLWIVYNYGGIYLDTDVELLRDFDEFLEYKAFFGLESHDYHLVATGLGFGAEKGLPLILELMKDYESASLIDENGNIDKQMNTWRNRHVFEKYGVIWDNSLQILDGNILILPSDYMDPLVEFDGKKVNITNNTISIHHYLMSWHEVDKRKRKRTYKKYYLLTKVKIIVRILLSDRIYNKIKVMFARFKG